MSDSTLADSSAGVLRMYRYLVWNPTGAAITRRFPGTAGSHHAAARLGQEGWTRVSADMGLPAVPGLASREISSASKAIVPLQQS